MINRETDMETEYKIRIAQLKAENRRLKFGWTITMLVAIVALLAQMIA